MGTYVCGNRGVRHTLGAPTLITLWLVLATQEATHPSETLKWQEIGGRGAEGRGILGAGGTTGHRKEGSVEAQALCSMEKRNLNDFQPGTSPLPSRPILDGQGGKPTDFSLLQMCTSPNFRGTSKCLALSLSPKPPGSAGQQKPAWRHARGSFEEGMRRRAGITSKRNPRLSNASRPLSREPTPMKGGGRASDRGLWVKR